MENLFVLPTDKPSRLHFDGKLFLSPNYQDSKTINSIVEGRNIYITSDEEIKEENLTKSIYVIDVQNGNIGKLTCKNRFFKGSCKLIGIEWSNKQDIWNYNHIREIILTTDQDLIEDGVQAIDDEFLEWFVKNPSCEKVDVKSEILYEHKDTYRPYQSDCKNLTKTKINYYLSIIPKEEPKEFDIRELNRLDDIEIEEMSNDWATMSQQIKPKQETLEEVAERILANNIDGLRDALQDDDLFFFYKGVIQCYGEAMVEWQQEQNKKLYSEEDMKQAFLDGMFYSSGDTVDNAIKEWFEQFKKK
jgi:hypothetical protein